VLFEATRDVIAIALIDANGDGTRRPLCSYCRITDPATGKPASAAAVAARSASALPTGSCARNAPRIDK
jgi:hypothetical protein